MNKIHTFFFTVFFLSLTGMAQVSPDCVNAIPICNNTPVNGGTAGYGADDFNGSQTSGCLERALEGTIESNSAWYRFRTGASGQLGFNIAINTDEDWDFALYQGNDCNNLGEPIRCNFFDNQDENAFIGVGEDPSGNDLNVQYEEWLQVEPGQDYYLLINNFSNNNSGFSIQFSGHIFVTNPYDALDCSIINNLLGPPISACEGNQVDLDATSASATIYNWFVDEGSGFNPIVGQHSAQLSVVDSGMYRVEVVRPMGNIYSDVQVAFSPMPVANLITDDASCSGLDRYDLGQKDAEVLGNQSPSEFLITYYSSLVDANAGINQLSKEFVPVQDVHVLYARITSLTNPRCFEVTDSFQLINLTTPVIDFDEEAYLCQNNSGVIIGDESPNANYSYQWDSGETTPTISVNSEGVYSLTVTNTQGQLSCSASRTVTVSISNPPTIEAIEIEQLSNNNTIKIITDMDAGFEFRLDDLPFQEGNTFYQVAPGSHAVTVNDPNGCGMVSETVVVVGFPKFFTPNSDGSNDYWQIEGIELLNSPLIHIFDRYGKLLVELDQNSRGWDGLINGKPLPESDYWFRLTYNDANGNLTEAKFVNNHFSLKR